MNITFFIQNMSRGAGSERVTALIANLLAANGHAVTIVSICGDNTCYYTLNDSVKLVTLFLEPTLDNRQHFLEIRNRLSKYFNNNKVDVCIDIFSSLCLYTIPLKKKYHFRELTWDHICFQDNSGMRSIGRKLAARRADQIITLTESDRQSYIKAFPNCKQRVTNIYNPSPFQNTKYPGSNNREKVVIAVGRLTAQKRFDRALRIWKNVEAVHPDWSLHIIGQGEEEGELKHLKDSLGLTTVKFDGQIEDMASIYKRASLMISTSETEGLPMVLIEALSFGVPIVSLDYHNGPRDIIENGINGLIAVGDSPDDQTSLMTKQILELIENGSERDRMSFAAWKSASRFDVSEIAGKWDSVLLQMER